MQQIVCKSLKDSPFEILKIAHVSSLDAQFLLLFLVNVPCLEEREGGYMYLSTVLRKSE